MGREVRWIIDASDRPQGDPASVRNVVWWPRGNLLSLTTRTPPSPPRLPPGPLRLELFFGRISEIAFARHMETSFSIQACKTSRVAGSRHRSMAQNMAITLADSRVEMTFPAHYPQPPACLPPSLLVSAIVARPPHKLE